uniref:Immunoglobulin domain-containing protein n=1 Tax=Xiphophorus maculatus TaxID=8083 RepID=A0A3B5PU17_XIPMA
MGNFSLMLALLCNLSWVALSASLFQTVTVRPDEGVTLRCANLSRIAGHIFWFKLNDGPDVSRISSMSTSEAVPSLHGEFQRGKFTMRSNVTNIFLDIKQVEVTDSGLYFCGFYAEDFPGVFAATYLHVEVSLLHQIEEPGNLLNWTLGGVVIFLAMVIINLVVKIRTLRTVLVLRNYFFLFCFALQNLNSEAVSYSALNFRSKAKGDRRPAAERETEANVIYSATR